MDSQPSTSILREDDMKSEQLSSRGDKSSSDVVSEFMTELPPDLGEKLVEGSKFSKGCIRHRGPAGVEVFFLDAGLWETFRQIGTEMIVTKKGRRVFPIPSYIVTGLDPAKLYNIFIKITAVDNAKHKFLNGVWVQHQENAHSCSSLFQERSTYLHPSSPNTGAHWMEGSISFSSLKISNNMGARSSIVLQSMRKYQMSLVISPQFETHHSGDVIIPQEETQFVAVTQYQNEKITQMKIEHNPFANSFRIRRSSRKTQDDNEENFGGESSSDDHTEQLPTLPGHAGFLGGEWTSGPSYIPPPAFSRTDPPVAVPWLPSHGKQDMQFPTLHAGQIIPPGADALFPVFPCTDSPFRRGFPTSNMLSGHQPVNLTLPKIRPAGRAGLTNEVFESGDGPLPLVKRPMLMNSSENSTQLGNPLTQERSSGWLSRFSKQTSKSIPVRLDSQQDKPMRSDSVQSPLGHLGQGPGSRKSCPRPEVTLNSKDVWAATQEVVVCEEGRPMYPHLAIKISSLEPDRLYSFCVELALASPWFYEYEHGEWMPSVIVDSEPTLEAQRAPWCHQHPDNPRPGRHWEKYGVNFEGLRLATAQQGKNKIKVQLRRQYFPVVTITTEDHTWQYPLGAAMFVTVGIDRKTVTRSRETEQPPVGLQFPPYSNLREANRSAARASFGRKQACPKKTSTNPEVSDNTLKFNQTQSSGAGVYVFDIHGGTDARAGGLTGH